MNRSGAPNTGSRTRSSTPAVLRRFDRSNDCPSPKTLPASANSSTRNGPPSRKWYSRLNWAYLSPPRMTPLAVAQRLAVLVAQEDRAVAVAADAVLAAQEEALQDVDVVAAERLDQPPLDVEGEQRPRRIVAHRLEDAERRSPAAGSRCRRRGSRPRTRPRATSAGRGSARTGCPGCRRRRPAAATSCGSGQLRLDDVCRAAGPSGGGGLAGQQRRHLDLRLVVVLRTVVADARRLEEPEVAAVGEHRALAVADVAVLAREQAVVEVLVVGPDADALRLVEEPGDEVGEVEEFAQLAGLDRDADLLAAAEEVLGVDRELAEEAVELAPAAAELQLGAVRLVALEDQVDLLLLACRCRSRPGPPRSA